MTHTVSMTTTLIFTTLLVLMVLSLALEEKIHAKKSLIVGVFAVVSLILGDYFHVLPIGDLVNVFGEKLHLPVYVTGIEWEVIAIILGSSIFVDVISQSGLFTWVAVKLTKFSKGDPFKLLCLYGIMTVVFSAVLNNVTAMIIVGSLSGVSLKKLKKENMLLGFLLIEGFLTNIGGLLTLISSVPNIIVGQTAGISFMTFFIKAAPFVVVATAITIWMGAKVFKITSLNKEEKEEALSLVNSFDEKEGLGTDRFFYGSAVILGLFIFTIATTSVMPYIKDLGMGYVAMSFGVLALIPFKDKVNKFYEKVDWDLLGFFIALFVVINVMEHAKVLQLIGEGVKPIISLGDNLGTALVLFGSSVMSSVTDNIPLSAILAKILASLNTNSDSSLWWAVIFGANLGGNLTPIGSASTLVAVTIIHRNKIKFSFMDFVKKAFPFAIIQILLAIGYVLAFA